MSVSEKKSLPPTDANSSPVVKSRSPLLTWGVVFLLAAAMVGVDAYFVNKSADLIDHAKRNILLFSVTAGVLILISAWLFFRSTIRLKTKFKFVAGIALVVLVLNIFFEFKYFTGDMVPVFGWRAWVVAASKPAGKAPLPASDSSESTIQLVSSGDNDFAHFMGPHGAEGVPDVKLDSNWEEHPPKLMWKRSLGGGLSGFAVVGKYAVTQEQRDEQKVVVCFEFLTGKPLWSHALPGRFSSIMGSYGPRATPTIADGKVYCQWAEGDLTCHAGATGEVLWSHDLLKEHNATQLNWGHSGSPLVVADKVIVSAGGPNGHSLVAYHKDSGELLWHAGDDAASYASPVHATIAGVEQIITVNEDWAAGHRPSDGTMLWHYPWPGKSNSNANTSQPVPLPDDHLFLSKGYGTGGELLKLTSDEEGKVTVKHVNAVHSVMQTKMSNLAVGGDYIYGLSDGILECIEWRTLERQWKRGRYGHAQMMIVGDKLLVAVEDTGEMAMVAASPEKLPELARFQALDGHTWNPFALVGPYLLVRNKTEAACYRLPLVE